MKIAEEVRVELGEASALVPLGGRRFLVADDERGIRMVDGGTSAILVSAKDDERVAGLEGMCRAGERVLAVREHDGGVVSFAIKEPRSLEEMGTLARPPDSPGKKNKGWEGIAFLPANVAFDKRDHLVAVHEGKPRAVGVFAWPSLKLECTIEIEGEIGDRLPDLSDVAVHPKTGELWILSDEGECLVRAKLSNEKLTFVAEHAVPVKDGEKPEGIAFDEDGALWLVTDDSGRLLRLTV